MDYHWTAEESRGTLHSVPNPGKLRRIITGASRTTGQSGPDIFAECSPFPKMIPPSCQDLCHDSPHTTRSAILHKLERCTTVSGIVGRTVHGKELYRIRLAEDGTLAEMVGAELDSRHASGTSRPIMKGCWGQTKKRRWTSGNQQ
jgi:hypothetical protein